MIFDTLEIATIIILCLTLSFCFMITILAIFLYKKNMKLKNTYDESLKMLITKEMIFSSVGGLYNIIKIDSSTENIRIYLKDLTLLNSDILTSLLNVKVIKTNDGCRFKVDNLKEFKDILMKNEAK